MGWFNFGTQWESKNATTVQGYIPRFVHAVDIDGRLHLVNIEQIEHVAGSESSTLLLDDNGNVLVRCVESVEQVAARIREVGGVVSGWGEATNGT